MKNRSGPSAFPWPINTPTEISVPELCIEERDGKERVNGEAPTVELTGTRTVSEHCTGSSVCEKELKLKYCVPVC